MVRSVAVSATSVMLPKRKSWAKEPMIVMTSGSRAATTLLKTIMSSIRVSGMAIASARIRSSIT